MWTPPPPAGHGGRRGRWLGVLGIVLIIVVAVAGLMAVRYAPFLDDLRAVRDSADRLSTQLRTLGPADLDRATIESLQAGLADLDQDMQPLRALMADDPFVAMARALPFAGTQVRAADDLVAAADSLVAAGGQGFDLAEQFVSIDEAHTADPSVPLLPSLVRLMADSGVQVDDIVANMTDAQAHLADIPPEAFAPIAQARDLVAHPLETYASLLQDYQAFDDVIPGILGLGAERRYLVLALNVAELRPAGGYSGTVGTITFDDGRLVDQRFTDVNKLDGQKGLPFIEAPPELTTHLLGEDQSWRLADAAWSPDFPTSARKALELYELETGETDIDGVIAITTYAFDRLLEVLGPVQVPDYGVEIAAGDTTMTLLGETRGPELTNDNRKDILDALARTATRRLLALPAERWPALLAAAGDIGSDGLALAWFVDPDEQAIVERVGWDGAVQTGPGDYLYLVEANMAPTSKYNQVVRRDTSMVVDLDADGSSVDSVRLDWQNDAGKPGEPYAALRRYSNNQDGWYGAYVRALVPAGSELITASGRAEGPVRGVESVTEDVGHTVFGNYLFMPPGGSTLTYLWSVPAAAVPVEDGWEYRLTVQKQPGTLPEPFSLRVDLPDGATFVDATDGALVTGGRVRFETRLDEDTELVIHYTLPEENGS